MPGRMGPVVEADAESAIVAAVLKNFGLPREVAEKGCEAAAAVSGPSPRRTRPVSQSRRTGRTDISAPSDVRGGAGERLRQPECLGGGEIGPPAMASYFHPVVADSITGPLINYLYLRTWP